MLFHLSTVVFCRTSCSDGERRHCVERIALVAGTSGFGPSDFISCASSLIWPMSLACSPAASNPKSSFDFEYKRIQGDEIVILSYLVLICSSISGSHFGL